ncbi:MAG: succinylglutamate desuccinylase/aspartoacylase family protein, partial [Phycisphaerae bacterium]|nr:succinylglutamate desuccinylase/aspartoacylase family protein [Phycisphaerae bacterium]
RAWIRARRSGILRLKIRLGQSITKGQLLGTICDAFGDDKVSVVAPSAGLVIGHTHHPLVNEGDAVIHLAQECVPGPGSA